MSELLKKDLEMLLFKEKNVSFFAIFYFIFIILDEKS